MSETDVGRSRQRSLFHHGTAAKESLAHSTNYFHDVLIFPHSSHSPNFGSHGVPKCEYDGIANLHAGHGTPPIQFADSLRRPLHSTHLWTLGCHGRHGANLARLGAIYQSRIHCLHCSTSRVSVLPRDWKANFRTLGGQSGFRRVWRGQRNGRGRPRIDGISQPVL